MSESERVERHFSSSAETPELEDYRPISPLVIVACVAGIASCLAVLHPLLWIIPTIAVIISVVAIVRLSSTQRRYSGYGAAVVALCFATLFGSYAPARVISRDLALYAQARQQIETWISLIQQGRVHEAHQLSMKSYDRFKGPESLAKHYSDAPKSGSDSKASDDDPTPEMLMEGPPSKQLSEFVSSPVIAKLLGCGEAARIEHIQDVAIESEYSDLKITERYRVSHVGTDRPESFDFLVHATRIERDNAAEWSVDSTELLR